MGGKGVHRIEFASSEFVDHLLQLNVLNIYLCEQHDRSKDLIKL